ncbi:MAG: aminodeoxychorismate lyase [Methylococcales bacterium]|nr:aminodeoxychorismate lyase [Methylococcales bacterium]
MTLVNGIPQEHIELSDRGFQYGDGLFETIAVKQGHPTFLSRHLNRLSEGCNRLLIPAPCQELLQTEVKELVTNSKNAILKIIITRGSGGRGYRQPDNINSTRVLSLHPFPEYPTVFKEQGISIRFCNTRLGLNPTLARIKHLNRLEQIIARAEWSDDQSQEGLMLDINDNVIEGIMTNLFYVKNDIIYTSPLVYTGVAGIMRGIIIDLISTHSFKLILQDFKKADLLSADEAFLCNSVIGIWPIKSIGSTHFNIGLRTRQLQHLLAQYEHEEIISHL